MSSRPKRPIGVWIAQAALVLFAVAGGFSAYSYYVTLTYYRIEGLFWRSPWFWVDVFAVIVGVLAVVLIALKQQIGRWLGAGVFGVLAIATLASTLSRDVVGYREVMVDIGRFFIVGLPQIMLFVYLLVSKKVKRFFSGHVSEANLITEPPPPPTFES